MASQQAAMRSACILQHADILMDPDFEQQRVSFCRENCVHFEVCEGGGVRVHEM
jgi:hypothetical protein